MRTNRNRDAYIAAGLFALALLLGGWAGFELLQTSNRAAAEESPTNLPLPSITGEAPTMGITEMVLQPTIIGNGLEDTAQTTTAIFQEEVNIDGNLAEMFTTCEYLEVKFQQGEADLELATAGYLWNADDSAGFDHLVGVDMQNGEYLIVMFLRKEMFIELTNIPKLEPGIYRLIYSGPEGFEAEFTDEGGRVTYMAPDSEMNEPVTLMLCQR